MFHFSFSFSEGNKKGGRCILSSQERSSKLNTEADPKFETYKRLDYCPNHKNKPKKSGIFK